MLQLFRFDGGRGGTFNTCVQLLVPWDSTGPKTNSPIVMSSLLVLLWGLVTVKVSNCKRIISYKKTHTHNLLHKLSQNFWCKISLQTSIISLFTCRGIITIIEKWHFTKQTNHSPLVITLETKHNTSHHPVDPYCKYWKGHFTLRCLWQGNAATDDTTANVMM